MSVRWSRRRPGPDLPGTRDRHRLLLQHRPLLAIEVPRTALRELSVDFPDDRGGLGGAVLAGAPLGQEDETFFPGGRRPVLRKASPLGGLGFPPASLRGLRARQLARQGGARGEGGGARPPLGCVVLGVPAPLPPRPRNASTLVPEADSFCSATCDSAAGEG